MRMLDMASVPGFDHDATRITVNVSGLGISGYEAARLLRHDYRIQAEMSDLHNVIFITTVATAPARSAGCSMRSSTCSGVRMLVKACPAERQPA